MANLKFPDTHNLVAFLSKPEESDGFEQIVDILNAQPIKYALTVNPTIYTSCIKQFWSTIKAKTINGEVQLHALADGKKIIINESTMRRDLQLEDVEGIDCLPNSTIFELLALMGKPKRKDTQVPQPSGPTDIVTDDAIHKELGDSLVRAATTTSSLEVEHDSGDITKTRSKATPNEAGSQRTTSGGNTLRSGEDILKLKELMELCNNLQQRVIGLEKTKTTQQNEIASLKRRVKKLEQKKRSRTHGLKRLHKVGMSRRVESSRDEDNDAEMFDVNTSTSDKVFAEQEFFAKDVNLTIDEVTLAQALVALKSVKPKVKGVVIKEPSTKTTTTTISSQQPSQDNGKGIIGMKNLWKTMKKKDHNHSLDEETAKELQVELMKMRDYNENNIGGRSSKRYREELDQESDLKSKRLLSLQPLLTGRSTKKERKAIIKIVRADGKSQMYRVFSLMLKCFSREDWKDLSKFVKAKYKVNKTFGVYWVCVGEFSREVLGCGVYGVIEYECLNNM
ncbi:hypothetical protein Tco_0111449 [Tanacetum coccineum]